MLDNISLIRNYYKMYTTCLSMGFCKINVTKEGLLSISAPRKDEKRTEYSIFNNPIIMKPRSICYVSPKTSKRIVDKINSVLNLIDYSFLEVSVNRKGNVVKIKSYTTNRKLYKKVKFKLFTINIGELQVEKHSKKS